MVKIAVDNLKIIVSIVLFISLYNVFFTTENTLIGVGIITALLMFKDVNLKIKRSQGAMIVFWGLIGTVVLPIIARLNPMLGLVINFIFIFWITYISSERISYKAYVTFILLYVLAEGNPVTGDVLELRVISIILFAIIIAGIYYYKHKKEYPSIEEVLKGTSKENAAFALKLAISLSLAMFLTDILNVYKHMWFTMTVLSLSQLDLEVTYSRINQRVLYTLIGSAIYVVVFSILLPNSIITYVTLVMGYIYTFIKKYHIQMVFITISACIANEVYFASTTEIVFTRIILILSGAVFAYIISKVNFEKYIKIHKKRNIKVNNI